MGLRRVVSAFAGKLRRDRSDGSPQWGRKILSVSELTAQVKRLLEKQVGSVWVTGEITNLRAQSSGHIYFTLKDAAAQLSCVLFSREKVSHRELLADGQKVILQGEVTVYEARGQYQLIVRAVELQGVGALQVAFEKLKQKLAAEGSVCAGTETSAAAISATHRPGHVADRRGDPRCAACDATAQSGAWKSFSRRAACKATARRRKSRRPSGC